MATISLRMRARDPKDIDAVMAALVAAGLAIGQLVGPLPARRSGRRAGWFLSVSAPDAELGGDL